MFRYIEDQKGVPLHFSENEIDAYDKLLKISNNTFRYLQECQNCYGYIPKLMLLFSALEALCGREEKVDSNSNRVYFTYNHQIMKDILDNSLYNKIYGSNGLRHKLQHGDSMDFIFDADYSEIIYKKIIKYLNKIYDIKISETVVSPQRNFHGNYRYMDLWLKFVDGPEPNLRNCLEKYNNFSVGGCERVRGVDAKVY